MSPSGDWIKLHRSMENSLAMSDDWLCRLWMACLLKANWRVGYFKGEAIQPGEFAFSYRLWCESLRVSKNKLVRGLRKLEDAGQIRVKAGHHFTTVTICKWSTYQSGDSKSGTPTDTPTDTRMVYDRRRKEGKKERRKELDAGASCAEPENPASTPDDSVMEFPTTGAVKIWHLTEPKLTEWEATFETLDVRGECLKARQWILDNPTRRKTHRGMVKFLGGWLTRAVDSGRGAASGSRRASAATPDHSGLQEWFAEAEANDAPAIEHQRDVDSDGELPF